MRNRIIIISGVLVITVAIYFGLNRSDRDQVELSEKNDEVVIKEVEGERKWLDNILEPVDLESDIEDSLLNAMSLKNYDNLLYIGDYGDMKIKRFLPDGTYINEIGIGQGRGPGEFSQFMDYYVSGDTIYILDLRNIMLNIFQISENHFMNSFVVESTPMRITGVKDALVVSSLGGEGLFEVYDKSGEKLNQFGELKSNQASNPLSVQGHLASVDDASEFVYVPFYASYLFYFNLNGERTKLIRTFDQREFPASQQGGNGDTRTVSAPETDMIAQRISTFEGLLYILYLKTNDQENGMDAFVDVYQLENGHYIHSMALPEPARDIAIMDDIMYLIRDEDRRVIAHSMNI
ncbi:MAG: hypothetical protein JJU13_05485 [Balneolaceae bacterium]|nr:hypothetical protein [Balneolaceae bacterium]